MIVMDLLQGNVMLPAEYFRHARFRVNKLIRSFVLPLFVLPSDIFSSCI
jgi:hypothetical protein